MSSTALFAQATDLSADDYCVLGLATCFVRDEGEIEQITVLEPIPFCCPRSTTKRYTYLLSNSLFDNFR